MVRISRPDAVGTKKDYLSIRLYLSVLWAHTVSRLRSSTHLSCLTGIWMGLEICPPSIKSHSMTRKQLLVQTLVWQEYSSRPN